MGLFKHKNKATKDVNDTKTKTTIKADDTLSTVEYQGPNVLGVFNQPSVFIYGHPANVKLSNDHNTDVQINLFVKQPALLGTIYQSNLLADTADDGTLPLKVLITTDDAILAKTLLDRLTNTNNLMIAATGVADTYLTKSGIRRAKLIVPFGSFMIISANGNGKNEITTTAITSNSSSAHEPQKTGDDYDNYPNSNPSNRANTQPPISNDNNVAAGQSVDSRPISGAENIDIDNDNSLDDFDTDSSFNQELKDL